MTGAESITAAQKQNRASAAIDAPIRQAINRVADSDCPILILGEPGTGKRTVAAQIHAQSHRPRALFQELACAQVDGRALRDSLSGRGTLYLAEICELSAPLQDSLLSSLTLPDQLPSCRLLFGSSHDPAEEVKSLRMREEFYYSISSLTLRLPPLRCRKREIVSIAESLLVQYARQFDRPKPTLCPEIVGFLTDHSWPENLSGLETAMKTLVIIGDQSISLAAMKAASPTWRTNGHRAGGSLKEATRNASLQVERQMISEVLSSTGGNRKRAADQLGISYKALLYKIKQIGAGTPGASKHLGDPS